MEPLRQVLNDAFVIMSQILRLKVKRSCKKSEVVLWPPLGQKRMKKSRIVAIESDTDLGQKSVML